MAKSWNLMSRSRNLEVMSLEPERLEGKSSTLLTLAVTVFTLEKITFIVYVGGGRSVTALVKDAAETLKTEIQNKYW